MSAQQIDEKKLERAIRKIKLSDVGEVESQFYRAERLPTWERNLSGAVAHVFGCTSLYGRQYCSEKDRIIARTSFVGVTPAQHIALYAFSNVNGVVIGLPCPICSTTDHLNSFV
ncbi:hypothetical protein [Pseudomonas sp. Irchel s3h9]|jgi:hypothetical protein|uniref:DUF7168 domain-containing protein n=1 Tax=Pseudomonas sp. Irchel s3h9 TaxID=2009192 RepID=UPI0015A9258A|nr:hypothetical protein [Pseudomonas sp. Irchel s3h9]